MTETSFPVVNQPLSDGQWKTIGLALGQGIIDRGGFPYRMGSKNDTNDTVTIDVDRITKKNEAILDGFAHQIDTAKTLKVPAVSKATTYEVGLVYDPTKAETTAGPITLAVWTAPADYSGGKSRVVLHTIERQPSQVLSQARFTEYRPRVSPQIVVSTEKHLPRAGNMLVDTLAQARDTGQTWRAWADTAGNMSWVEMQQGVKGDPYATPLTAITRWSTGRGGWVEDPVNPNEVANKRYADKVAAEAKGAIPYSSRYAEEALIMRWEDGRGGNVKNPRDGENIANKQYVDAHTWGGEDITWGTVPYERIAGSKSAYATLQSGYAYTVSVNSAGKFMRFSSVLRHKTDVQPYMQDPREVLAVEPYTFRRILEDGTPDDRVELGYIADWTVGHVPEAAIYAPAEDGSGMVLESLYFNAMTAAQQLVLRWLASRADAAEERADAAEERLAKLEERMAKLETAGGAHE